MEVLTANIIKHIDKYEKRTGSSFLLDWNIKEFPNVLLFSDGRILTYGVRPNYLEIGTSTCDVPTMIQTMEELAKSINIKKLRLFVVTPPKILKHLATFKVLFKAYDEKLGRDCWLLEREVLQ